MVDVPYRIKPIVITKSLDKASVVNVKPLLRLKSNRFKSNVSSLWNSAYCHQELVSLHRCSIIQLQLDKINWATAFYLGNTHLGSYRYAPPCKSRRNLIAYKRLQPLKYSFIAR